MPIIPPIIKFIKPLIHKFTRN
ncbi:alpha family phenol-soluble modulin [Staphylococcus aureus]